jgi:hypothetical protein
LIKTEETREQKDTYGIKPDFLSCIRDIGEIATQAGGLNDLFFEFAGTHLDFLCDNLQISRTGAALYAILINLYDGNHVTIVRLASYMHLKCIEVMSYMDELEILEQKGLIYIKSGDEDRHSHFDRYGGKIAFDPRFSTIDALRKGDFQVLFTAKNLPIDKFFVQLGILYEDCKNSRQSYKNTILKITDFLKDNDHLLFVQKLQKINMATNDLFILLYFFEQLVNEDEQEIGFRDLVSIFDRKSDFNRIKQQLRSGGHYLSKNNLIVNNFSGGFGDTEYLNLTDFAKDEFLVEMDDLLSNTPIKGLKRSDSITIKTLFYPEKTQQAINELSSLLQSEHFLDIQKRLSETSMRTGFACLFLGRPGTGKTETAFQIARTTGRDIMQIDIANIKSKWFGESEKLIKKAFDNYRICVKKCKITPILLFNEADAIFGKRQLLGESHNGVAQTENAIQNIILQEIENLSGILIATTNLSNNIDYAFERRFLYKIEFEKPNAETRKSIWCSLINGLSDEDAWVLSSRFDFSGGQIENISRKSTVHRVLSGNVPSLEDMIKFCNEECLCWDGMRKMGFVA